MTKKIDEIIEYVSVLHISQATTATFSDLYFSKTFLFFIQNGSKVIVDNSGNEIVGNKGDILVCAPGSFVTMKNRPHLDKNYQAIGVSFDGHLIKNVFNDSKPPPHNKLVQLVSRKEYSNSEILSIFLNTIDISKTLPPEILESRLSEPLLWLKQNGYIIQLQEEKPLTKVRRLIETDLSYNWSSKCVADHFAMSEATMRRWLSKTGYSFAKILLNTRLENSLSLLQTTEMQIIQIALECGFKSPSHFSEAFKRRFGISPRQIRQKIDD